MRLIGAPASSAAAISPSSEPLIVASTRVKPSSSRTRKALTSPNLVSWSVSGEILVVFMSRLLQAARFAAPAVVLRFVLAGFVALLATLCMAELAPAIPVSGGAFASADTVHGALIGWFVGYALIVEYLGGASVMAIGRSGCAADGLDALGL